MGKNKGISAGFDDFEEEMLENGIFLGLDEDIIFFEDAQLKNNEFNKKSPQMRAFFCVLMADHSLCVANSASRDSIRASISCIAAIIGAIICA